eukprot:TRINITY_DN17269_c0_g1_i1.p1 TRINITY_DN17269_c0_g1~~TRINITY_DN17269_c0_g1_i1.p1  ORF type:complete len:308 (-),score=73.26 TRINITY_DN17269_c0_g1_i1:27-950(-)
MKKRTLVKCAAANDEDFDDIDFEESGKREEPEKRLRTEEPTVIEASPEAIEVDDKDDPPAKKKKEFAWMDSDDDEDGKDSAGSRDDDKDDLWEDVKIVERQEANATTLDEATSFGHLVELAPSLQDNLKSGKLQVVDVAAAYRALGRLKFFDGELLESLNRTFCEFCRKGRLTDQLARDAIEGLSILNAYDKKVFGAVAKIYRERFSELDAQTRSVWLQSFKHFHQEDKDFIQMLEVPPLAATDPRYKAIRCQHHAKGSCALGSRCTFSHDPKARPDLVSDVGLQRPGMVMLTACQLYQGHGAYTRG